MKIGIIGGGAAGLTAAWLLNEHHDVTLFEKQDRLGGHAHSIEVVEDGKSVFVESGFEFFTDVMFPTFMRLLNAVGAAYTHFPITATLYRTDRNQVTLLPPVHESCLILSGLKPASLRNMLLLQWVLDRAEPLLKAADTSITYEQFMAKQRLPAAFKTDFLLPFFLTQWCVEPEEFQQFAAYNVFKYASRTKHARFSLPMGVQIIGGTEAYIEKLVLASPRVTYKCSTDGVGVTRAGVGYQVREADGTAHDFDHLIIATNPRAAYDLLADLPDAQNRRDQLARIETFKTVIAVHRDRRWMPADPRHWSVVNIRYDGKHAQNTIYHAGRSREPIFRSWVTFDEQLPASSIALTTYEHLKVNLAYYAAQKRLQPLQGQDNLWLAGLYMHDIDCHESALISTLKIVQRLDPNSANLQKLV